ncbi:MAG TPA: porin family protein [Chitinophagales bacterium]|nr:porin family protein [Chitinophagales bacterium]
MKAKLITALLAATLATAQAQPQARKGPEIGFLGGPGAMIFYRPFEKDATLPMSGGLAGLSMQYNFTKIVALRSEINYERKGALSQLNFNGNNGQNGYSANVVYNRLHYITVPVMAKLSFGRRVQFFTNIGLYAGFKVKATETVSSTFIGVGDGALSTNRERNDITPTVAKVDGGLVTGIGLTTHFAKRASFLFELRNNLGFADIHTAAANSLKQHNNATYMLFGFAFNLSKNER